MLGCQFSLSLCVSLSLFLYCVLFNYVVSNYILVLFVKTKKKKNEYVILGYE